MKTTTNLNTFLKQFKANAQLSLDAASKTINAVSLDMYREIVQRTPVGDPSTWNPPRAPKGYVPGKLKASWNLVYNNSLRDASGRFSNVDSILSKGGISLKLNGGKQSFTIYNPQPYAQRVEEGWSQQAPQGMMRSVVAEYAAILDRRAAQYRIR